MTGAPVTIATADGEMPAEIWLPSGGSGPGILLLQEIFGVSAYMRHRAQDLADLGYVVLAPQLYWRLDRNEVEGPDAMQEAFGLVQQLDWDTAARDAVAALTALRERDDVIGGIGIVGFCYGGGLGFDVASRTEPDVLVSYYGSSLPDLLHLAPQVTARSLHHFGTADSFIDQAAVERVRSTLESPHVTFLTYEGADHAFDNDDFHLHHPEASREAWGNTVEFLAEHLPVG